MTEYNPNYEFAGGTCTLQDLREVDRDNLILVKYIISIILVMPDAFIHILQGTWSGSLWRGVPRDAEE